MTKAKETGVRDVNQDDYDENGILKDKELAKHFDDERKKLLGETVGSNAPAPTKVIESANELEPKELKEAVESSKKKDD